MHYHYYALVPQIKRTEHGEKYFTYGITCDVDYILFDEIDDICSDTAELEKLIRLMNIGQLSASHFREVIEDFTQNNYKI